MTDEVMNATELAGHLEVSRMTVERWRKSGRLPPPVKRPKKHPVWPVEVIEAWQAAVEALQDRHAEYAELERSPILSDELRDLARTARRLIEADHYRLPLRSRLVHAVEGLFAKHRRENAADVLPEVREHFDKILATLKGLLGEGNLDAGLRALWGAKFEERKAAMLPSGGTFEDCRNDLYGPKDSR
jgi:hypothetical protein